MRKPIICMLILVLLFNILALPSISYNENNNSMANSFSEFDVNSLLGNYFTLNEGQVPNSEVVLYTQNAYFTTTGVVFRVLNEPTITCNDINHRFYVNRPHLSQDFHILKLNFLETNNILPVGRDLMNFNSNFFIGNQSKNWVTDVQNFKEIYYENLYDNIDLVFRTVPQGTKYEFIVHPGGEIKDIQLKYDGAAPSSDGYNIYLETPFGTILDGALHVYQFIDDDIVPVEAKILIKNNIIQYDIKYDPNFVLVIDPLVYSTFIGDRDEELGYSLAIDSSNNAYVTGYTWSSFFPTTPGSYNGTNNGSMDVFVMKLNSIGSNLVYSTFLGGTDNDEGRAIVLDSSGNTYVTGFTESLNFPTTPGVVNSSYNGGLYDAFVFKLNSAGNKLVYSTFVGGSFYDQAYSIALDSSNNVYITGYTLSLNFPTTPGALKRSLSGLEDIFVVKLNPDCSNYLYSTYVGGTFDDQGYSLALDSSKNVYVTGSTNSPDFPTTSGAFNESLNGSNDVFVFKLNSVGSTLIYSSLVGGTDEERGYSIALDSSNNAYVTGYTWSSDFPMTQNAYKHKLTNWTDVFIFKLNSFGSKLIYSTYIGGNDEEYGHSIVLDSNNNVYITGYTWSSDFPITTNAYDKNYNSWEDVFILILNTTSSRLMYSTFFGGNDADFGYSMVLDQSNHAYVTGSTESSDFPIVSSAFDISFNEYDDVFVFKLSLPRKPNTPKNLEAIAGDSYIQLNWEPPDQDDDSKFENYNLYKGTSENALEFLIIINGVDDYNDTDVMNGVTYYYAISSENSMGESQRTEIVSGTPGAVPTPPRDLVVRPGKGYILLTWEEPFDDKGFPVTHYKVYRGVSESSLSSIATLGDTLSYNDTNVEPGKTYFYAISAINIMGASKFSDVITSAVGNPPSPPINLTAEKISNFVYLTWLAPEDNGGFDIKYYRIYKGLTEDDLIPFIETNIFSYLDTTVAIEDIYYYAVSAVNLKGEGELSDVVFATKSAKIPEAPILNGEVSANYIKLFWNLSNTDEFEILFYKIYRGTVTNPFQLIGLTSDLSFFDYNVTNNITYSYVVSGVNLDGEGYKSNIFSGKITAQPGMLFYLTALSGNGYIQLQWHPPEATGGLKIIKYNIYKGVRIDTLEFLTGSVDTYYNDSQVKNGVIYHYAITAVNEKGEGPLSEIISVKPLGYPGQVSNLSVIEGNENVLLTWEPPVIIGGAKILSYRIYRGTSENRLSFLVKVSDVMYNDTSVINGIIYYYKVSAVNDFGEGTASDIISAYPGAPPGPPLNPLVGIIDGRVVLTWDIPTDDGGFQIVGYKIFSGPTSDNLKEIAFVDELTFKDEGAEEGKMYYYQISGVNQKGDGTPSKIISINVGRLIKKDTESKNYWLMNLPFIIIIVILFLVIVVLFRKKAHKEEHPEPSVEPEGQKDQPLEKQPQPKERTRGLIPRLAIPILLPPKKALTKQKTRTISPVQPGLSVKVTGIKGSQKLQKKATLEGNYPLKSARPIQPATQPKLAKRIHDLDSSIDEK